LFVEVCCAALTGNRSRKQDHWGSLHKRRNELTLAFQLKGYDYTESVANLTDSDDLPVRYTQVMTIGVAYPPDVKRVLMIGLGGGSISSYLGRFMPDAAIDTIEIDPGVITAAKSLMQKAKTAAKPGQTLAQ